MAEFILVSATAVAKLRMIIEVSPGRHATSLSGFASLSRRAVKKASRSVSEGGGFANLLVKSIGLSADKSPGRRRRPWGEARPVGLCGCRLPCDLPPYTSGKDWR